MKREQALYELMMMDCEECPFNKICDAFMYNSDIRFCSLLSSEIEEIEWWEEDKNNTPLTLRDLGFGEDNTPAKYVEIGSNGGYLGAVFGIEGNWKVVLGNKYGRETKYTTINIRNLDEIKEIE